MANQQLVEWIRVEHEKVEKLADRLREQVAIVPRICTEAWITEALERFEHLRAHLHKHMALEDQGGYMAAIVDARPSLASRVERLEQEHRDLACLLDGLHELTRQIRPHTRLLLRDYCRRTIDLLSYVEHHEQEENDLISLVYTVDEGTLD